VALEKDAQRAEGLSLVAHLVNNTVKRCQIRRLRCVPEDFFLGDVDIDLREGARFEKLHQQTRVRLPAYEDIDLLRVVAQVDAVRP